MNHCVANAEYGMYCFLFRWTVAAEEPSASLNKSCFKSKKNCLFKLKTVILRH